MQLAMTHQQIIGRDTIKVSCKERTLLGSEKAIAIPKFVKERKKQAENEKDGG